MSEPKILSELRAAEESITDAQDRLTGLSEYIEKLKKEMISNLAAQIEQARYTRFNPELLPDFLAEPYVIMPKRSVKGRAVEWYVVVPRFIDFQLGWLLRSTRSFNVFRVDQYTHWFTEIPKQLKEQFKLRPLPLKVADGLLLTTEELQDEAWKRYKRYLSRREGKELIRIKRGREFELIAQIIEDGHLPFIPRKVEAEDLRDPGSYTSIKLRDYQRKAWKEFLATGAVGIYYPFGTGKSWLAVFACGAIAGRKLVIVPTITLKEKWLEDLRTQTRIAYEVDVETYHSFHKVKNNEYKLTVFDECQHLPANTYIRMATLNTKYRIGLSGSPYREDGRVNYIIALTGKPLGLAWEKFFELGIVKKPLVTLYIVRNRTAKLEKLKELMTRTTTGKTIIFCDGIDLGKRISRQYELPFVYGDTVDRLAKIRQNEKIVVSRVGDEGISIPDIDTLIEVDFLFGSRMQESQRSGRLFHSKKKVTNHYILMTEEELQKYGKRLLALYERGFRINTVRG